MQAVTHTKNFFTLKNIETTQMFFECGIPENVVGVSVVVLSEDSLVVLSGVPEEIVVADVAVAAAASIPAVVTSPSVVTS